jgi:hypothetical protein
VTLQMTWLEIVVLGLATWRISSMLVDEDGPFTVFARVRHLIGVRFDEMSYPVGKNWVADQLTCIWCTSVPVGIGLALYAWMWPQLAFWTAVPFALSAVAALFNARGIRSRKAAWLPQLGDEDGYSEDTDTSGSG